MALALPVLILDSLFIRFDFSLLVVNQQAVASMGLLHKRRPRHDSYTGRARATPMSSLRGTGSASVDSRFIVDSLRLQLALVLEQELLRV